MTDRSQGMRDGLTQTLRAFPVVLQQVIGHSLSRFWPDAGQAAQRLDQRLKTRWIHRLRTAV